ncbi:site-specific integrase [Notoacmeibacter sp. MSK16QG-6]|uniref:tyrosine-type recombinase/integrase n=1 Tax=Notoacmeibacter sp. MSK16QG-6 TaxID=2957982 RepID=UPI0020A169A2|nr:site-specific integrase [Notoacmeibacter sp. MSK16QG-6]MCP1199072.1 site-specific integrase [Notoacmeibacter sp. MSK16QG-6]
MTKPRLTKQVVDALPATGKDYVEWCGKLSGFGCRVRGNGHKTFVVMYRAGGRNAVPRKVTIGTYGKLTVDQARVEASKILAKAQLGEDVAAERAKQRAEMTVSELCDEYMQEGVEHKKPSTIQSDISRIEAHIRPLLGRKRIGAVSRADIERFLRDVAQGKTAREKKTGKRGKSIVKGGKGTATRTVRLLGGIFTYAVRRDYVQANPCRGVQLYKDGRGDRFLKPEEFRRLGETLKLAETDGLPWKFNEGRKAKHRPKRPENQREVFSPHVVAAIRLLMLTGCRLREILHLRWEEVDFERGILNLPDSKTGQKKIVVPRAAIEILSSLERSSVYVIAGNNPDKPRADLQRPWQRITEHAELQGLRLHDLRHTYASIGAESGMGLVILGKLLGHKSTATTQRYAHLGDDPLKRTSEHIADTIMSALSAARQRSPADS